MCELHKNENICLSEKVLRRMFQMMFTFRVFFIQGSHSPTGQTMLDRTTQLLLIPPRDRNLDLHVLPVRYYDGC